MYNRYMPKIQDINDYIELDTSDNFTSTADTHQDVPPQMPSFFAPQRSELQENETSAKAPILQNLLGSSEGRSGIIGRLLGSLRISRLDIDDILLLLIAFLLLREDGDGDLVLIIAALYLLGGKN